MRSTADFLVIGGGIVGLTVARELKRRHQDCSVVILEKEQRLGEHASGRNSGILHAGFYYSPDSLKAKLTRDGNRKLYEYCLNRGIEVNRCGKLVVTAGPGDLPRLDELQKRGEINGVELQRVSESEAREIEPRVKTFQTALFSPTTAVVDPKCVLNVLADDLQAAGSEILTGCQFQRASGQRIRTSMGEIEAGFVINAAGLYADKIARHFGFSNDHTIQPLKGLYLRQEGGGTAIRTNIYPTPDPRMPFLGVHVSLAPDGSVQIGPSAMLAFWRENYGGLSNFSLKEFLGATAAHARMFVKNVDGFRRTALRELQAHSARRMVRRASRLVDGLAAPRYWKWLRPGIRAQLVDRRTGQFQMDFVVEGDDKSLHILNAVSPAFTSSMAFAEYLVDRVDASVSS